MKTPGRIKNTRAIALHRTAIARAALGAKSRSDCAAMFIVSATGFGAGALSGWLLVVLGLAVVTSAIVNVARALDHSGISASWPRATMAVLTVTPIVIVTLSAVQVGTY